MKNTFLTLVLIIALFNFCSAQNVSDPMKVSFVTKDITNFWNAFDKLNEKSQAHLFEEEYIKPGSAGLQAFIPNGRIESAVALLEKVRERKDDYVKARANSLKILDYEKQCRASFLALKYLYPEAVYPNVYFVIGRFSSGGFSSSKGIVIGAEMVESSTVPYMVAHELIHYQQDSISNEQLILLAGCINEGSADFIAELISGKIVNKETHIYGNANEAKLWREFQDIMDDRESSHEWLYSYKPKNGYPPDLGYWMGYKITESYYQKATDKRKAISEILHIKDYKQFLKESGYASKFK